MSRYLDWFKQAKNDIQWAEHSLDGGFFSQTCFIAQQSSEKALQSAREIFSIIKKRLPNHG